MSPGHAIPHAFPSWESVYGWLAAALEDATTFQRQRDAARREAEQRNEWLTKEREAWRRTEECLRAEVTREQAGRGKAIADLVLARAALGELERAASEFANAQHSVSGDLGARLHDARLILRPPVQASGGALLPSQEMADEILEALKTAKSAAQPLPPATPIRREIAIRDAEIDRLQGALAGIAKGHDAGRMRRTARQALHEGSDPSLAKSFAAVSHKFMVTKASLIQHEEALELARVKLDGAREALEAEKATSDRVRTLLYFALQRQAERCDHSGIGLPGCRTCDPIARDEAKRSPAAQSEGGAR